MSEKQPRWIKKRMTCRQLLTVFFIGLILYLPGRWLEGAVGGSLQIIGGAMIFVSAIEAVWRFVDSMRSVD